MARPSPRGIEKIREFAKSRIGKRNPHWKGSKYSDPSGHIHIQLNLNDPLLCMADQKGYILRSRYKMAKNLGRPLANNEIVHHKNEIASDDKVGNLGLKSSHSEHANTHWTKEKKQKRSVETKRLWESKAFRRKQSNYWTDEKRKRQSIIWWTEERRKRMSEKMMGNQNARRV